MCDALSCHECRACVLERTHQEEWRFSATADEEDGFVLGRGTIERRVACICEIGDREQGGRAVALLAFSPSPLLSVVWHIWHSSALQ